MPAYRPLVKVIKPVHKQIQVWPEGSSEALQDCFDTTVWNMFKQAATYNNTTDLQEYTETVTAYITKCIDDVTVTKTITVRANQKPWLTGEVYRLLKARNAAFRAGDEEGLKTARAKPIPRHQRGQETIHQEDSPSFQRQQRHSEPVAGDTDHYGLQAPTTDLWTAPCPCWMSWMPSLLALRHKTAPLHRRLHLLPATRWWILSRINARKAPGPDNIPGRVLRDCAVELTDVFTDIFNISLSQAVVPTCFKATTIIPVPKKSSPSCFNDYRPVALTHILMKCFERLVMQHIKSVPPPSLDPFQFAYRSNHSTDDAIATALHPALTHLDKKDLYVRMLFIDFVGSLVSLSPPSRTSTAPVSPTKPSALQVIPPTRHIASSVCCHQGGDCVVSRRGPADWRTASFIRLSGSSTLSRLPPPPLSCPMHHWTLTLWHPPPHTHTHCDQHQSLCTALEWPHSTTSSDSLNKDCSFCHFK